MLLNLGSAEQLTVYSPRDFPFDKLNGTPCGRRSAALKRRYISQVCAFDIETTKYFENGKEKRAMFCWQFSFNNEYLCFGRTAPELQNFFRKLSKQLSAYQITVLVHNLSYEFNFCYQFLAETFGKGKCFFLDTRRIARMTFDNLTFTDTFILCPMSLDRISVDYDLHYKKATDDLDYDKLFNIRSELTPREFGYCMLDVLALVEYYQKEMQARHYNPSNMPMTKTALVRYPLKQKSRNALYRTVKYPDWIRRIQPDYEVFCLQELAMQGGYTAVNAGYRNSTVRGDIRCRDFTSSYPAWIMLKYFPISKFELMADTLDLSNQADYNLFVNCLKNLCCLFTVEFTNIRLKTGKVSPIISGSKCMILENDVRLNGKIAGADRLRKVVNEIELQDILTFYDVDTMAVEGLYTARRGPLPDHIKEMTLQLFRDKTQLRGIPGKELEYLLSKSDLNSIFGMMAMNPIREELELDPDLMRCESKLITPEDREKKYYKVVNSRNNFLLFSWGLYVCSWARHYLFEAMTICGANWLYSDTDSVYYISTPEIEKAFDDFNARMTKDAPGAINKATGRQSILGEMTPDGEYAAFRGLGAKKYALLKKDGSIKLTVAGVPKNKAAVSTLNSIDDFRAGHLFKGTVTGKLRPEYVPDPIHYANVNGERTLVASYINLWPTDYVLNDSRFDDFIFDEYVTQM